jgi:HAD superfamily hydrolase (TIGR01509 family)
MRKSVIDLVIYDCDGTLIDSERLVAKVCLKAIHGLGLTHWTLDQYCEAFIGMPSRVGWAHVEREYGQTLPKGLNEAVDAHIHLLMQTELEVLPGVRDAIQSIAGDRCVASSTPHPQLVKNIRHVGLQELFEDNVFSATQVRRAKPAPDVFLFAASQMGHDASCCLVVEDSVPGVVAARRAGMKVVGYTGAAHDPVMMREKLLAAGALVIADHMNALPDHVANLSRA